jgi:hypothetical protein
MNIPNVDSPIPPDGFVYEWKRESLLGWRCDQHLEQLSKDGWRFVPAPRYPEWEAGTGGLIRYGGMVLMERQVSLQEERLRQVRFDASETCEAVVFRGIRVDPENEIACIEALRKEFGDISTRLEDYGWPEPVDIVRTSFSGLTMVWGHEDQAKRGHHNYVTWAGRVVCLPKEDMEMHFSGVGNFRLMKDEEYIMTEGSFHGVCVDRSAEDTAKIINQYRWVIREDKV